MNLSLPKAKFDKTKKNSKSRTVKKKPKGVTTQMKALDENILMVVFMLLLNRVHVFAIFTLMFLLFLCLILTEKHGSQRVNPYYSAKDSCLIFILQALSKVFRQLVLYQLVFLLTSGPTKTSLPVLYSTPL